VRAVIPALGLVLLSGAVYSHVLSGIERSIAAGGKGGWFCGGGGWIDCTRTLGSDYGVVMGLPVTVYATAWFAFLLTLLLGGLVRKQERRGLCRLLFWVILPGVGVTLFYAGLSVFVLHTFCLYCAGLYLLVGLGAALAYAGMEVSRDFVRPFLRVWALPGVVFLGVVFTEWGMNRPRSPGAVTPVEAAGGLPPASLAELPRLAGSEQAKLRILKFTDFKCPACRFSAHQLHRFMATYPGEVDLRCVNIPLHQMKTGKPLSASECLAALMGVVMHQRGLFWPYYDGIYFSDRPFDDSLVWAVAERLVGRDQLPAMRAEVESAEIRGALAANIALARSYHVDRTPTMLINGHMELGALEFREWETKLAEARAGTLPLAIGRSTP
jgi:uncharacterized membrane protein/protein-disulfide isomerase